MEYIPRTLAALVKENKAKNMIFPLNQAISYLKQLLQPLLYLENLNICHRDIKPCNILIGSDGSNQDKLYLCDFGSAKCLKP